MAVGVAFYQWAQAGMLASMLAVPAYVHRPVETPREATILPWSRLTQGQHSRNANMYSANATAFQALLYGQAADRYRLAGGPAGAIAFAAYDLDSAFQDIGRASCSISTDSKTVCFISVVGGLPEGLVAAAINELYGKNIAGTFNGISIMPPSGDPVSPPPGVTIPNGQLTMVLG